MAKMIRKVQGKRKYFLQREPKIRKYNIIIFHVEHFFPKIVHYSYIISISFYFLMCIAVDLRWSNRSRCDNSADIAKQDPPDRCAAKGWACFPSFPELFPITCCICSGRHVARARNATAAECGLLSYQSESKTYSPYASAARIESNRIGSDGMGSFSYESDGRELRPKQNARWSAHTCYLSAASAA